MDKLAILVPSRNERYLYPTIRDCFTKAAGEVEVVVHLDGYWPDGWAELTNQYPNLHTVHSGEPCGMRPGINKAAASAIQRGAKYLLKLDAHCMLDEDYDQKLLADIEPDWIVVPRRKRLDAENWKLHDVGKPDIDYHYLSFPDDPNDWGGAGLNGKPWNQRILDRKDKPEFDIDDEMSSQGSAWLMAASYFTELELMDHAAYGPFWNEAQELFLKCWLSGGKGIVNKKTWYAHLRKGKDYEGTDGKKGRGYTLPESWLQTGRNYTLNWIYNEAWAKQTKPFEWLIDHFWPVPGWPENWREVLYATRRPRLVGAVGSADSDGSIPDLRGGDADAGIVRNLPEDSDAVPLKIHSAVYGVVGNLSVLHVDVAQRVRELVRDNSLDIVVNNSTLVPGQNPFRGKKKRLLVRYSIDGGEVVEVARDEKDWLIIGPVKRTSITTDDGVTIEGNLTIEPATVWTKDNDQWKEAGKFGGLSPESQVLNAGYASASLLAPAVVLPQNQQPMTAPALNDYLIRKFSISPQRLRGPMPIELRDFHRNDLAQLFAELGFRRGAEIGVAEGNYSEVLLRANPECELFLVDPWHHYDSNPQGKSKEKHEFAFNEVKRKTAEYPNVRLKPMMSMAAVDEVADESLDFFYCDGNHLFDYAVSDLIWWSKKLRSGGICSGDDFYQLDQKRWVGGGVVEAVQAYVNAHRIPVWYIFQGHKSIDFAWVKP